MSDEKIQTKLLRVQMELKAPKDKRNSFGGYSYRSCESILEAVKPLLAENHLTLTLTDEIVEIGGRVYVKAKAGIIDDMSNVLVTTAFAREPEVKKGADPSQITGAASSYARKYALSGLFCIDDNKDPDTDEYHRQTKESKPDFGRRSEAEPTKTDENLPFSFGPVEEEAESVELRGLKALMKKDGITEEMVLSAYKGKYSAVENIEPEVIQRELLNNWTGFVDYIKNGGKK